MFVEDMYIYRHYNVHADIIYADIIYTDIIYADIIYADIIQTLVQTAHKNI